MKVEKADRRKPRGVSAPGAKTAKAPAKGGRASFRKALLVQRRGDIRAELDALMGKIEAQAREIERTLTFETLNVYSELVRKFVQIAVNELFEVEEELSIGPTGKQKSMILVKKINAELEEMAEEFLNRQANLLSFMGRIDGIRGLLIDLYS
ncbi:MAG: YaaR family protein [bacterium]